MGSVFSQQGRISLAPHVTLIYGFSMLALLIGGSMMISELGHCEPTVVRHVFY